MTSDTPKDQVKRDFYPQAYAKRLTLWHVYSGPQASVSFARGATEEEEAWDNALTRLLERE